MDRLTRVVTTTTHEPVTTTVDTSKPPYQAHECEKAYLTVLAAILSASPYLSATRLFHARAGNETRDFREADTEHPSYGGFADVRLMRSVGAVVSEHRRINETSSTVKGGESATSIPARRNRHFSRRDTDGHRPIVSEASNIRKERRRFAGLGNMFM
jgi:hypothetical protein